MLVVDAEVSSLLRLPDLDSVIPNRLPESAWLLRYIPLFSVSSMRPSCDRPLPVVASIFFSDVAESARSPFVRPVFADLLFSVRSSSRFQVMLIKVPLPSLGSSFLLGVLTPRQGRCSFGPAGELLCCCQS